MNRNIECVDPSTVFSTAQHQHVIKYSATSKMRISNFIVLVKFLFKLNSGEVSWHSRQNNEIFGIRLNANFYKLLRTDAVFAILFNKFTESVLIKIGQIPPWALCKHTHTQRRTHTHIERTDRVQIDTIDVQVTATRSKRNGLG